MNRRTPFGYPASYCAEGHFCPLTGRLPHPRRLTCRFRSCVSSWSMIAAAAAPIGISWRGLVRRPLAANGIGAEIDPSYCQSLTSGFARFVRTRPKY